MGQIQQQGKDMLEIVEKWEIPREYHDALWDAYERGAEMGFWKAAGARLKVIDLQPSDSDTKTKGNSKAKGSV